MERWASQWRGTLTKSEKFSGHKGWRRPCTRRRTSPDDGRCTHCYSKCGMEPSSFTKSCFLNVLKIIVKQSLGCLKHSLQWKTGQCLQRIHPCFQVLSPHCNFIIYKNCHFPPARGKISFTFIYNSVFTQHKFVHSDFSPSELFVASARFPHMNE